MIEWLKTAKTEIITFLVLASPILSQYTGIDINVDTVGTLLDTLIQKIDAAWMGVAGLVGFGLRHLKKSEPPK